MTGQRRERARRHHLVPASYLRRWADDRDRLHVLDVKTGKAFVSSVTNASVRSDFFTVDLNDGPSDELEKVMSTIESLAKPVLDKITGGMWPLESDDRGVLANFVALQIARAPWIRQTMNAATTEVMRLSAKMTVAYPEMLEKAARDVYGPDPTDDDLAELAEALTEEFTVEHHRNDWIELFDSASELVQPVFDMRWTLLLAHDAEFVTCDQPLVHWAHDDAPGMALGFFTARYTTLPVSPECCVRMGFVFEDNRLVVSPEDDQATALAPGVEMINLRTAMHADRSVFSRNGWTIASRGTTG